MNDSNKWIKIHSQLINWEWYKNQNVKDVFLHCLLKANWKDGKFEGIDILRGSFVTSLKSLSDELGLSVQTIRTSLKHLILTKELTMKSYNKFRIITINNYEFYQQVNKEFNKQLTNNQQTTNNQLTTIEEYKNNRQYTITTTNAHAREETLFEFIEKSFGRTLSPAEYEIINSLEDNELTRYVIKQAELSRVFNLKYVLKILASYKQDGITTVSQAEERDKNFKARRQQSQKSKPTFKTNSEIFREIIRRGKESDKR